MQTKSKFLKTAILAALVGLAGAAAVTPASAHEFDRHGGYHRDRDYGWGRDRGYHGGWDRHDHGGSRGDHRHFHRGWY
jgi:Ni/Co efflux regulator RcnB